MERTFTARSHRVRHSRGVFQVLQVAGDASHWAKAVPAKTGAHFCMIRIDGRRQYLVHCASEGCKGLMRDITAVSYLTPVLRQL